MRVWNGKIRAENVLVEGGIESVPLTRRCQKGHPTTISAITAVFNDFTSTLATELWVPCRVDGPVRLPV
jgi:hypothetical protein